jgi:hypothetical protein
VLDDGRTLYVSNRGHDTITQFALDAGTGEATLVEYGFASASALVCAAASASVCIAASASVCVAASASVTVWADV